MRKITLGKKDENIEYIFREACFGIYVKDNKLLVTFDPKYKQYTLVGGGLENNENKHDSLRREFKEEVGLKINGIKHFVTIDCFWLADNKYPMEYLTHFYLINNISKLNIDSESKVEFIDINNINLPLPYQNKAIELLKKESNF